MGMNATTAPVINLKTEDFRTIVIDDGSPILLDFWAPWCGPCRMMKPHLEETARQLAGSVRVAQVNVDEEPAIAEAFGIRSIPTLVLMKSGQVVNAVQGVVPASSLVPHIEKVLGMAQ